jgi:signal peptidase I
MSKTQSGWKNALRRLWQGYGISLLTALLVAFSFKSAVAELNVVPTGSMKPTILEGDRLLINKLAYDLKVPFTRLRLARWADPKRGDIVVFPSPADGTRLVKRVVGLPGDHLAMVDNHLVINGKPLALAADNPPDPEDRVALPDEPRLFAKEHLGTRWHRIMLLPTRPFLRSFAPMTIPPGHYFVMGDNRDNSGDSRFFGLVPRRDILGRSTLVAVSLDPQHYWLPRIGRFFHPLDANNRAGDPT